jgi:hypothetical protein
MTTDHHAFPEYHQTATPVTHGTLQINLIALSFLDARGFVFWEQALQNVLQK